MKKKFLIELIKKIFYHFFNEYGFKIKEDYFSDENQGNLLILLQSESENFRLRVINERGQIYIDIGSCLEEIWFDLNVIINYIKPNNNCLWEYDFFDDCLDLKEKIRRQLLKNFETIKSYHNSINRLFSKEQYNDTRNKLEQFEKELFQKRWRSI